MKLYFKLRINSLLYKKVAITKQSTTDRPVTQDKQEGEETLTITLYTNELASRSLRRSWGNQQQHCIQICFMLPPHLFQSLEKKVDCGLTIAAVRHIRLYWPNKYKQNSKNSVSVEYKALSSTWISRLVFYLLTNTPQHTLDITSGLMSVWRCSEVLPHWLQHSALLVATSITSYHIILCVHVCVCVCVNLIALAVVLEAAGAFTVAAFVVPTFDLSWLPTSNLRPEGVRVTT